MEEPNFTFLMTKKSTQNTGEAERNTKDWNLRGKYAKMESDDGARIIIITMDTYKNRLYMSLHFSF